MAKRVKYKFLQGTWVEIIKHAKEGSLGFCGTIVDRQPTEYVFNCYLIRYWDHNTRTTVRVWCDENWIKLID